MASSDLQAGFPRGLAVGLIVTAVLACAGGAWVIASFTFPSTNGEVMAFDLASSVALQVLAGLMVLAGLALLVWLVVPLAGRLPPEGPRDEAIDAKVSAALANDESLGPSETLAAPSGLPWERA